MSPKTFYCVECLLPTNQRRILRSLRGTTQHVQRTLFFQLPRVAYSKIQRLIIPVGIAIDVR